MRCLTKSPKPQILIDNEQNWKSAFQENPDNVTNKRRYAHPDVKEQALKETHSKCIYCESKIGHNTPGDIEHIEPVSVVPAKRFEWENLSIACTECNRRKNDYFSSDSPFLNPYKDDVEYLIIHRGPIVDWRDESDVAEISVKILELNSDVRIELIKRKIEAIGKVNEIKGRIIETRSPIMRELLEKQLRDMAELSQEYSGMIKSLI